METEEGILKKLNDSVIWAKYDYLQYKKIFLNENKEYYVRIMDAIAPNFFTQLNGLFWDRMILSVSKLTDPYKTKENKNLSIDYLVYNSSQKSMKCKIKLNDLFIECLGNANNIRTYRSKIVAHKDFTSSFYSKLEIHISEIENVFRILEKMMNIYHLEFSGTTWSFDMGSSMDAGTLLYHLERALIYKTLVESRQDWKADGLEEMNWRKTLA